jgi:hypothetical protein
VFVQQHPWVSAPGISTERGRETKAAARFAYCLSTDVWDSS